MSKNDFCHDCYNNFYNQGSKECWHLKNAKIVTRIKVGVWQNPPYENRPVTTLNCNIPDGFRYISTDDERVKK